jgi:phenylpropionate dioxygenase-like ring-hydroxylating dioxygenase large terminal subunit
MFEGFANVWTPVTLASRLKKKPLSVTLAGERLVFFRGRDGVPAALLDRCPHRGVQLSLGTVTASGCLACPFHAWEFDGAGRAAHVPLNPEAKRERLSASALPTRELGGLLWVYTRVTTDEVGEPTVPDALLMPKAARTFIEVEWKAHWTRAMENMLDSPHVPYVHASTIGRFVRPFLKRDSTMHIEWEDTAYGGRTRSWLDEHKDRELATLDFFKPNIMVLNIPIPKQTFRMHAICVPVGPQAVRMLVVGARTFATLGLLNPVFNYSNMRIVKQDQAVVESSHPIEVPPAADEVSVRTDRATLQFRKYYYQALKPSAAPAPPRVHA